VPVVAFAQIDDTFATLSPAWVTDRYPPAGFQVAPFLGGSSLQITINQTGSALNRPSPTYSSSFFNTQGDQRPGGITGDWTLSANVYVSSAFDTTTGQLVETDLWAETGATPADGAYAIFGITNASPTDPLNPEAADRSFSFEIFNSSTGWFDLGVPAGFVFNEWSTLSITSTGTDFEYSIDGNLVFTEPTTDGDDLQTVFLEAYNFGQTDANGLNSYSLYWDNLDAAVIPEPSSFALAGGLLALGMVWTRRRVSRKPRNTSGAAIEADAKQPRT
jgi:hypothetical protein